MKYSYVIWDIDGTLLDTREGVVSATAHTLEQLGYSSAKAKEVVSFPKIKDAFQELFQMTEKQSQEATNLFRDRYKEFDLLKAVPYDGIYDVMEHLRENGVKQAIATNKRQDYTTRLCIHFGFDQYCHPIYGTDHDGLLTKDKLILACLEWWKGTDPAITSRQIVMVGDTSGDKEAAGKAGIDFIGVNYGFGFQNVDGYVPSAKALKEFL